MKSVKVIIFSVFFGLAILTVLVLVVIFVFKGDAINKSDYKIVDTSYGQIRGARKTTLIKNIDFYSFKGIPYAKSPTGDLRFKAPEPHEPWRPDIRFADEHGNTCFRPSKDDGYTQSEDCLFLNVYVPADVEANERLAVMVFIHGGAFSEGTANDDMYGPDFLLEQRVILITFNYRLGLFGFLTFGTTQYSGNMGLKDQQLALKWIQENIEQFLGDNKRITLFGESAGGVLTHFHILSSESRKYFRNAILLSGTAENLWAYGHEHVNLDVAHKIAKDLKQPQTSVPGLIKFFKTVPAEQIVDYANIMPLYKRTSIPIWAPVVEKSDDDRPFMVEYPEEIYAKSHINIDAMFGVCSAEYLTFYAEKFAEIFDIEGLDKNFTLILPFRDAKLDFDSKEYTKIAAKIRKFYFKDAIINEKVLKQYIDLLSDINFGYGVDKAAKQHANKTIVNTFYYRFSIDSSLNIMKKMHNGKSEPGAGHADDLCYVFRCGAFQTIYDQILKTPDDEQSKISLRAIDNITKLFANFAKHGEPSHEKEPIDGFLPIEKDKVNFLDVVNGGLKLDVNINQGANELWARIEKQVPKIRVEDQDSTQDEL